MFGPGMGGPHGFHGGMGFGPRPMFMGFYPRRGLFGSSILGVGLGAMLGSMLGSNIANKNTSYNTNNNSYNSNSSKTYELYNYCPNCGSKREGTNSYCGYCGESLIK